MKRRQKDDARKFAMFGYMKSDPDIVGWLAFTDKSNTSRTYEIVQDVERARLFPDKPAKPGDVSAAEWLEFFDRDPELADWKFHLALYRGTTAAF